jgi:MoxR-like ATPase
VEGIKQLRETYEKLRTELRKVIVGQEAVIEQLMLCLLARGHGLLMGVPGLAKTLLISSLSETLQLDFSRIQFTPDLMPADITGTDILQETDQPGRRAFEFIKGPIFANIVLADEINRAPAKTQSALLEAMQEHKVTALGKTFDLTPPFFVLATQNPVEQEGTYPLPEAQLDRFMFLINVDYPSEAEELAIAKATTGSRATALEKVIDAEGVMRFQSLVRRMPVPEHVYQQAVTLVRRTRPSEAASPDWLKRVVTWGAGPRAVQYLILGAKARAALHGSYLVREEDLEAVAAPVLNHRILTNFAAQSEGLNTRTIVERLFEEVSDSINR